LLVRGIPFRAIDTAGITASQDTVEKIGIERSRKMIDNADVLLLVLDRSRQLNAQDEMALEIVAASRDFRQGDHPQRLVVTLNKSDLPSNSDTREPTERLHPHRVVESNVSLPDGLDDLRVALESAAVGESRSEHVVGNVRHQEALRRASGALRAALDAYALNVPLDLVSIDVRAAISALGEITGAHVDSELLDRIFRDFCIGK
jgi:tRNA modification GTPase